MNGRRRGGASASRGGRTPRVSPSENVGRGTLGLGDLGAVLYAGRPWDAPYASDWMSKVAREGIGGVRLA